MIEKPHRNRRLTFFILNLGCPKNLVDSEKLVLKLMKMGLKPVSDPGASDVVIVNTCGFIRTARSMSSYHIKKIRKLTNGKLIVTGCYPKRVGRDSLDVPADFVTEDIEQTVEVVRTIVANEDGDGSSERSLDSLGHIKRINTLSRFSAYLKISDGCSRTCSFCSIPKIKGPLRSVDEDEILSEARYLAEVGVRELIVVSQDTTMWNVDKGGRREDIFKLLDKLSEIPQIEWIRLFYVYPDRFALKLIDYISENPKIVRYIEIPFQHVEDRILAKMGRATKKKLIYELFEKIRLKIPDMSVRTELIVGFPGETDRDFKSLVDFVETFEPDWIGVFEFSPEDGTPAFKIWKDSPVPKEKIRYRKRAIMEVWSRIFCKKQIERVGKIFKSIYESDGVYRAYFQAPEIDGVIMVRGKHKSPQNAFENIKVTSTDKENLIGIIV